eukprot:scaffold1403_cov180-Ochromonas_danica.AAC.14
MENNNNNSNNNNNNNNNKKEGVDYPLWQRSGLTLDGPDISRDDDLSMLNNSSNRYPPIPWNGPESEAKEGQTLPPRPPSSSIASNNNILLPGRYGGSGSGQGNMMNQQGSIYGSGSAGLTSRVRFENNIQSTAISASSPSTSFLSSSSFSTSFRNSSSNYNNNTSTGTHRSGFLDDSTIDDDHSQSMYDTTIVSDGGYYEGYWKAKYQRKR